MSLYINVLLLGTPLYDAHRNYFGDKDMMEQLSGNILVETDPGFVDAKQGDFRLREDSPACELGFKPIPFDKIGLYVDEYRTTLP